MRDGNASMYLGSPRMAEMVIGEKVTLEEMGGARMHTGVERRAATCWSRPTRRASTSPRRYLSYFPSHWEQEPPPGAARGPRLGRGRSAT